MEITLSRLGKFWKKPHIDKKNFTKEETLTVSIDGKELDRGICYQFFSESTGIKLKKGEVVKYDFTPAQGQERSFYASLCPETDNECLEEIRGTPEYRDGRFM